MRTLVVAGFLCTTASGLGAQVSPASPCAGDRTAQMAVGSPQPAYPPALKASDVRGEVVVQFVVDASGTADTGTFKVIRSSDAAFAASVRAALPSMRFVPACINGRAVRQLVSLPFAFGIPAPSSADSATVAARRAALKSDLKNYAVSQEAFFADNGHYATSLRDLRKVFQPSAGVIVVMLAASGASHSAIAIDRTMTDLVCALDIGPAGKAAGAFGRSTNGAPVCRGPDEP
jgi:TonB family protein